MGQEEEQLGQYVEPVQLQVVCYQLREKVAAAGKAATAKITMADLQQSGDVNSTLADFYNQALATVFATSDLPISERRLRTWFDNELITEAGTRGTVYQGLTDTAGLPNPLIKLLTDQFLLRTEQRAGGNSRTGKCTGTPAIWEWTKIILLLQSFTSPFPDC